MLTEIEGITGLEVNKDDGMKFYIPISKSK